MNELVHVREITPRRQRLKDGERREVTEIVPYRPPAYVPKSNVFEREAVEISGAKGKETRIEFITWTPTMVDHARIMWQSAWPDDVIMRSVGTAAGVSAIPYESIAQQANRRGWGPRPATYLPDNSEG